MQIYDHLVRTGWMPVSGLPSTPSKLQASGDRLAGMLWGAYLGDALGNTSESQLPTSRRSRFGEVTGYPAGRGRASDDSQMAFWTLEHLLEHGSILPQKLAARFCLEPIRGLGGTVRAFLAACREGKPWHECSVDSLGNGSLMRIAPVLAAFLSRPGELYPNVAVAAALTHRSAGAVGSCLAFISLLRSLLELPEPISGQYSSRHFLQVLEQVCPDAGFVSSLRSSLELAQRNNIPLMEMRSGACLLETVPALLLLLDRYGDDPVQCVTRAVNDTYDNDSLGSMVGACMGALHGLRAFPLAWVEGLEPRVSALSRPVGEMIGEAVQRWAAPCPDWERVVARLGALRTGPPIPHGALHLVPLLGPDLGVQVDLLEEAPSLVLSEVGRVDRLQGTNQGQRAVWLLDGEAVTGGLQNRMLRSHVVIGASQQVELPVSCVERGRWGSGQAFSAAGHLAPPSVRTGSSQSEVWEKVETQLKKTRSRSQTRAMQSAYSRVRPLRVAPLRGQVGVLALLGEKVLCLEVAASADLYARLHDKLLASLALESHGVPARRLRCSRRDVAEEFLSRVGEAGSVSPGLSKELRFTSRRVQGQALVHEGQLLCLSAFPG